MTKALTAEQFGQFMNMWRAGFVSSEGIRSYNISRGIWMTRHSAVMSLVPDVTSPRRDYARRGGCLQTNMAMSTSSLWTRSVGNSSIEGAKPVGKVGRPSDPRNPAHLVELMANSDICSMSASVPKRTSGIRRVSDVAFGLTKRLHKPNSLFAWFKRSHSKLMCYPFGSQCPGGFAQGCTGLRNWGEDQRSKACPYAHRGADPQRKAGLGCSPR